jgi:two-component system cell cycle sensor histidine kinase PleC
VPGLGGRGKIELESKLSKFLLQCLCHGQYIRPNWSVAITLSFNEFRRYSDRRIFASLAAITIVALLATFGILIAIGHVLLARQQSIQITKIQAQLSSFNILILEAETAQRGYLLTGDTAYLAPYTTAVQTYPVESQKLATMGRGQSYTPQLNRMLEIASNKMAELKLTISTYQLQGPSAAMVIVEGGSGLAYMDQIRTLMSQISSQQASELAVKRARATADGAVADDIGTAMLVAIALLAGLVYYLFIQAMKAERSLEMAKGEFVSLASHQLRTPATGVKSILSVLGEEGVGPLNGQQKRLLSLAADSNDRELRIVEELLNVAKAESGQMHLNAAHIDLRKVVASVVDDVRPMAIEKNQRLEVITPKHPVWLEGDAEKLYMAISNLVDNACKYTPDDGFVSIRIRASTRYVRVEVSDSGRGIDTNDVATIFDKFGRADATISATVDGSGLGLYLARQITRLHNGSIEVTSRRGHGSTFALVLPRKGAHIAT